MRREYFQDAQSLCVVCIGLSTPKELADLYEVSTATGVVLDPVYTGKGMLACENAVLILLSPRILLGWMKRK